MRFRKIVFEETLTLWGRGDLASSPEPLVDTTRQRYLYAMLLSRMKSFIVTLFSKIL